jgi:hypothetical protein
MASKPFGQQAGRPHFPQLENQHLSSFGQRTFFIEVDATVELEHLSDPMLWGPQPRVTRGSILHAMRADNSWFATMVCFGSVASYPDFRLHAVTRTESLAEPSGATAGDRVEYVLGAGWTVTAGGEIVAAGLPSQQAAQAILAEHLGEAVAA